MKKFPTRMLALAGWLAACTSIANAQQSDFVVVSAHIDNVRQSKSVFTQAADCENNPLCVAAVKVIGTYFGVPLDRIVTAVAAFDSQQKGEGTYTTMTLPSGYVYCKAGMKLTSIVPHDGPRGSLFLGSTRGNGLYYETWTPRSNDGSRSWVEADVNLVGVRQTLAANKQASGVCQNFGPGRAIWYCRGGGCDAGSSDNGQAVPTSSPPPSNGRN